MKFSKIGIRYTLLGLFIIGAGSSTYGYFCCLTKAYPNVSMAHHGLESLYRGLLGFWLQPMDLGFDSWFVQIGRWIALIVTVGFGWQAIQVLLQSVHHMGRAGMMRNHTIVCGYGELGSAAVEAYLCIGKGKVVIIEKSGFDKIPVSLLSRCAVLDRDASDLSVLQEAGLHRADQLIVCCGNDDLNAAIARLALDQAEAIRPPRTWCQWIQTLAGRIVGRRDWGREHVLAIHVHIDNPRLLDSMRTFGLSLSKPGAHLNFFNIGEMAADTIVERFRRNGENPETLAIIGWNWMTESLVVKLADFSDQTKQDFKIFVAAPRATAFVGELKVHYPFLKEEPTRFAISPVDIDLDHLELGIGNELFKTNCEFSEAIVCLPNDIQSMTISLALLDRFVQNTTRPRVLACIYGRSGLAGLLEQDPTRALEIVDAVASLRSKQRPGGAPGNHSSLARGEFSESMERNLELVKADETNLFIAEAMPLINRVECTAMGVHLSYFKSEINKPPEDRTAQCTRWEWLNYIHRDENRKLVISAINSAKKNGFAILPISRATGEQRNGSDEGLMNKWAELEHQRWVSMKEAAGWKLGDTRSLKSKTHPDMQAWTDLKSDTKKKDLDIVTALVTLLKKVGLAVYSNPANGSGEAGSVD